LLPSAYSPCLVELPAPVVAGVGGVDEQRDLARSGGGFDLVGAIDEVAGPSLHPKPVERVLAKSGLRASAEISRHGDIMRLERALERRLKPAFGVGCIEFAASDPDPGAAAWSAGAHVRRHAAIRAEREADQFILRAFSAREDARPLRDVRLSFVC
jgi:hypothetical protein